VPGEEPLERGERMAILADRDRLASRRTGQAHPSDPSPASTYVVRDQLGSATIVLDVTARSSTGRSSPNGETTFGSFTQKRYRFAGKERDEFSGLYLSGAQWLAPHLARWPSPGSGWAAVKPGLHSLPRPRRLTVNGD
jgi:hypothetical protein